MSGRGRVAAVVAVVLVLLAAVVVLMTADGEPDPPGSTATPSLATTAPTAPTAPPSPTPSPVDPADVLTDVDRAIEADAPAIREAMQALVRSENLVVDAWEEEVAAGLGSWPVIVGEATIAAGGAVDADVLLAGLDAPAAGDPLVLRLLPAASVLGDVGLDVTVEAAGERLPVEVDRDGARLLVDVAAESGEDVAVRVRLSYTVPDASTLRDDGGPAGFGLLSRTDDVMALGHWLPLPTLPEDEGPMLARGDVGAFPVASWSLVVHHDHHLVTGGVEADCPTARSTGCTWVQGTALRDVSAALIEDAVEQETSALPTTVVAAVPATLAGTNTDGLLEFTASATVALSDRLGPLPWPELDVVPVAFAGAAAGMEFPGMIWVERGAFAPTTFGHYVAAHEVGHQWFHALVGNGSLSAPVVDESLAQYLSYLAFADVLGQATADALAAQFFGGRHEAAIAEGVPDEPPAQELDEFSSAEAYGAAVYGRGGQTWVDAEHAAGRDAVVAVVAEVVNRYSLEEADVSDVLGVAQALSPAVAEILRQGWGIDAAG